MEKSYLSVNDDVVSLGFFFKYDPVKRTVTGVATTDCIDKEGDLVEYEASKEAFEKWMGNIREMHGPKAVGNKVETKDVIVKGDDGQTYRGLEVTSYISKGAEDTWQKILDGTLKGYSIGGRVLEKKREFHKATGKIVTRIVKYALGELSVVDNPCNPLAMFTMVKSVGGGELEVTDLIRHEDMQVVYYCNTDEIATIDQANCSSCGEPMNEIGFVESMEGFTAETVSKMIEGFDLRKDVRSMDLQNKEETVTVSDMDNLTPNQKAGVISKFLNWLNASGETLEKSEEVADKDCEHEGCPECECHTTNDAVEAEATTVEKESNMEKVEETVETAEVEATDEVVEKAEAVETEAVETVEETVEKAEAPALDLTAIVDEIKKAVADTVGDASYGWKAEFGVFGSKLEDLTGNVERLAKRVDDLESKSAIKKSVDIEKDEEVEEVIEKSQPQSVWGNVFVPQRVIEGLGYEN